jgi:hypothetical protein
LKKKKEKRKKKKQNFEVLTKEILHPDIEPSMVGG